DNVKSVGSSSAATELSSPHESRVVEFGELVLDQPAHEGEVRIEGIPAGRILATVETGKAIDNPRVLASASVVLRGGDTGRVTLRPIPELPARVVPLDGTLSVPLGWPTGMLSLELIPIDLEGATDSDRKRIPVSKMETSLIGSRSLSWDL